MKKILSYILLTTLVLGIILTPLEAYASSFDAGIVSVARGKLNVRRYGSTSSSIISTLTKGIYVTIVAKSGDWMLVEYAQGKYGYCHSDYITIVSGTTATVKIDYGTLNVRSGGGTNYAKTDSLSKGKQVFVISSNNGWSHILYDGVKTGYVSSRYLSSSSPSGYSAISLDIPNYKQTDSRWSNVKIGNSGKTIGQIGCVTTGIAMMESYRSGKTIYPDAMSRKLSYSSSGNVYWPNDFVPTYTKEDYLERIYDTLKVGKPVLIGGKTSSGGQHWVVITGYSGGETLTESSFIINDPGSEARNNLKQFFNAYPIFYKYFYYN